MLTRHRLELFPVPRASLCARGVSAVPPGWPGQQLTAVSPPLCRNSCEQGVALLDCSCSAPDPQLVRRIVAQVEFYLSDENLAKDAFLLKHVQKNKMGFVSIKLLTSFKKVGAGCVGRSRLCVGDAGLDSAPNTLQQLCLLGGWRGSREHSSKHPQGWIHFSYPHFPLTDLEVIIPQLKNPKEVLVVWLRGKLWLLA